MNTEHQAIIDQNFRGRNRLAVVPAILQVIDDLERYHPLTVRQVYYQLVAAEVIENSLNEYQGISAVLTKLRKLDVVPWSVITDRSRRVIQKRGISNVEEHIRENMRYLFNGYSRCLVQNQENYIEVWTEKDALSGIFEEVVWRFCCRIGVCRGMPSATFIKSYANRAWSAVRRGQSPVILYFGDLDPTGMRIPEVIQNSLLNDHDIPVRVERIALWPGQVVEYDLPHNPYATKKTDSNYRWYCKRGFGEYSVELDALHPEILTDLIEDALVEHLDTEDMDCQEEIEQRERQQLKRLRLRFLDLCHKEGLQVA